MINKNFTLEAMPQNQARLEEKVDALTAMVSNLQSQISSMSAQPKSEDFILIDAAAETVHLSIHRIRALAQTGRIPHYKPGKELLFLRSELIEWVKQSRHKGDLSVEEQMANLSSGMHRSAKGRFAV